MCTFLIPLIPEVDHPKQEEKYQLGDYWLIQFQILPTNIT